MTIPTEMFPWAAYALDAWQRSVLFLDVLRQRGNAFLEREDDADAQRPHLRLRGGAWTGATCRAR